MPERKHKVPSVNTANVPGRNLRDAVSTDGGSEYAELMKRGGLEAVNSRVKGLLDTLKASTPLELLEQTIGETNHILRSAIRLFPQSARGVEITLIPGIEKNTRKFERRFGKMLVHYRDQYDRLLKAFHKENGIPQPESLILPLPYTSADRSKPINIAPGEDVYLGLIAPRNDRQILEPVLAVRLNRPYISSNYTLFALPEVESIRFTEKEDFTPYLRDGVLIDKGTPEAHYLRYRNFRRSKHRNSIEILIPEPYSNLWQEDPAGAPTLIKGFLVSSGVSRADTTLFEITNTGLLPGAQDKAAVELYAGIAQSVLPARQFKGTDIVRRLFEIPVDIKRF